MENQNSKFSELLKKKTEMFNNFEQTDLTRNRIDFERRKKAIANGIPSILIISTARSASSGISNQIAEFTSSPRVSVDAQPTPIEHDMASGLLSDFMRGGAISYVHSRASNKNLMALTKAGVVNFILHIRDPRQCLLSNYWRMHKLGGWQEKRIYYNDIPLQYENWSFEKQIDWHIENVYVQYWVSWIEEWVKVVRDRNKPFNVKLTTYEQYAQNPPLFFFEIGKFYGLNWPYLEKEELLEAQPNPPAINQGNIATWREEFTENQIKNIQSLTPKELLSQFNWEE